MIMRPPQHGQECEGACGSLLPVPSALLGKRITTRGLRSVTMKRNRSAVTVWLIVGDPAPLATRCS
jgi:hypothetical protein